MNEALTVVNLVEGAVKSTIEDLLQKDEYKHICKCEQCKIDIIAYALNKLRPRYVATVKGSAITSVSLSSGQWRADIVAAICEAIEAVSKKPHHES